MKQKEELGAADRIRRLEAVRAELAERQAEGDAELGRPWDRPPGRRTSSQKTRSTVFSLTRPLN